MKRIDPRILKKLREARGWTQDELAKRTRMGGSPPIDKQTISRLERGERSKTRGRTIEQLARALAVEPDVLTGEKPVPDDASFLDSRSQLGVRVATAPRNALGLVARRYQVEPAQIIELAPFLFLWAAEESLRQRRERAYAFWKRLEELHSAGQSMPHLRPEIVLVPYPEEAIGTEMESIEKRDLFGKEISLDLAGSGRDFDAEKENPFTVFLRKIVEPFGHLAEFEAWSGDWTPQYRVCPDEAAELVGGDKERAEEILGGLVSLSEMPKDIGKPQMTKERAEWVRVKAEEYSKQLADALADLEPLGESEDQRG